MRKLLIENILRHPKEFHWSTQGLGMLRIYLAQHTRLHIWDRSLLVPGVSPVHTHPWDFKSTVVVGLMRNTRFIEASSGERWNRVLIKCGEDACTMGEPEQILMQEQLSEQYREGDEYQQASTEIHLSHPEDGTVTIVERVFKPDTEHAYVYWRGKGAWVDAKPRPATPDEVQSVTQRALETWF